MLEFGIWNLGFAKLGWPTGLEPATTRTTIWGSTIELRPPFTGSNWDSKIPTFFCKQRTRHAWRNPLTLGGGETHLPPEPVYRCTFHLNRESGCGFDHTNALPWSLCHL